MANDHRIYRRFRPWRFLGRLLLILIAHALFLSIFFYVWFKRYIVYTDDGLYLDIPGLADPSEPTPERSTPALTTPEMTSPDASVTAPWEQNVTAPWEQGGTDGQDGGSGTGGDQTQDGSDTSADAETGSADGSD